MTNEEKDLLLEDLVSRLPYDVRGFYKTSGIEIINQKLTYDIIGNLNYKNNVEFKPYLFPLSSMTEKQEEEFKGLYYKYHESAFIFNERFSYDRWSIKDIGFYPCYLQDWLNKNHFDYRNLIPKGLAKDATGLGIY